MQVVSLVKQSAESSPLLLFFGGWATDENPFKVISSKKYDVVIVYDYCSFEDGINVLDSLLESYNSVIVCAWSMGVWAAARSFELLERHRHKIVSATAINGTLEPINPLYGIAPEVFSKTLANLPEGLPRFNLRMCGSKSLFDSYCLVQPSRGGDELRDELAAIGEQVRRVDSIRWSRAVIASNDMIITTQNQRNFWLDYQSNCNSELIIESVEGAHFIFSNYQKWEQIIDG